MPQSLYNVLDEGRIERLRSRWARVVQRLRRRWIPLLSYPGCASRPWAGEFNACGVACRRSILPREHCATLGFGIKPHRGRNLLAGSKPFPPSDCS